MNDAATGWTDDRVETLARLWAEGLSASQIAASMGGVTRNAVIGKVHRLGLSGRGKTGQPAPQRPAKPRQPSHPMAVADTRSPAVREPGPTRPVAPTHVAAAEEAAIPPSARVTILALRDSMCRWPIGDPSQPDFGFCGARSEIGLPYCAHHCSIAYQPVTERKRLRA